MLYFMALQSKINFWAVISGIWKYHYTIILAGKNNETEIMLQRIDISISLIFCWRQLALVMQVEYDVLHRHEVIHLLRKRQGVINNRPIRCNLQFCNVSRRSVGRQKKIINN